MAEGPIVEYEDYYEQKRVFVQEVASARYTLTEERRRRLDTVPRVIHTNAQGLTYGEWNLLDPGQEPFRTQSLQSHFVILPPGGRNDGHGHQNEAFFYILEGRGYELHDGQRYDWSEGDAVVVHNDCVHWHNNADSDRRAVALVIKAKPLWLFLGLWQQGKIGTKPTDDSRWGPREEYKIARDPKDAAIPKVIHPSDTQWQLTPHGRIRVLADAGTPLRVKALDGYLQEIAGGGRSGKRWQMADELFYVLEGEGYDLHWEVEVEIDDQYYARFAKEPTRWDWKAGDLVWIPQNTVFQHFNAGSRSSVRLLCASNRIYKQLGYSRVEELENAPEYDAARSSEPAAAGD
ncbi:MAG TPA: cupin domain-containing protein [Dehalococcoidia bacterium]|nr:cupin domain-containing protein [Dehalococcoidia bacterium]